MTMDGKDTAEFFRKQTYPVIANVLTASGNPRLLHELSRRNVVLHGASLVVVRQIARELLKGGYIPERELPFLQGETGRSNASSATTPVAWQHQIARMQQAQGQGIEPPDWSIDPDHPILVAAPGVGAAITAGVIRVK